MIPSLKDKDKSQNKKKRYLPTRAACCNCIVKDQVSVDERVVLFLEALVLLGDCKIKEPTLADG